MPYDPITARLSAIDTLERERAAQNNAAVIEAAEIVIRQTEDAARNYRVFTMYAQPRDFD